MPSGVQVIGAVLATSETVHEDDQGPSRLRRRGTIEHGHQDVAAAICQAKAHTLADMWREVGLPGAEQYGDRLKVRAPPGEARPERRQVEGIDGRGHVESVFTVSCHEN